MDNNANNDLVDLLNISITILNPETLLKEKITTSKDIYFYREYLFQIFRSLIFHCSIENQWIISVLIKNQELTETNINWLIENWYLSNHIINRLLLYPVKNEKIINWAKSVIQNPSFPEDRKPELFALLIGEEPPEVIDSLDNEKLIFSILRSKESDEKKIELLLKYSKKENFKYIIDAARKQKNLKLLLKIKNVIEEK